MNLKTWLFLTESSAWLYCSQPQWIYDSQHRGIVPRVTASESEEDESAGQIMLELSIRIRFSRAKWLHGLFIFCFTLAITANNAQPWLNIFSLIRGDNCCSEELLNTELSQTLWQFDNLSAGQKHIWFTLLRIVHCFRRLGCLELSIHIFFLMKYVE